MFKFKEESKCLIFFLFFLTVDHSGGECRHGETTVLL